MIVEGKVGPAVLTDGSQKELRLDKTGVQVVTDGHSRFQEAALRNNLFSEYLKTVLRQPIIPAYHLAC